MREKSKIAVSFMLIVALAFGIWIFQGRSIGIAKAEVTKVAT